MNTYVKVVAVIVSLSVVTAVIMLVIELSRSTVMNGSEHKTDTTLSLPVPDPKYMKIEDPAHVIVRWDPVNVSKENPILGFKIKLWEDEKQKIIKFVENNEEQVLVEEWEPVKKSFHALPTHKPAFEAVVPLNVFEASFDVTPGENYELRGQSYNADGEGPLSSSFGFRIHTKEEMQLYKSTSTERSIGADDNAKVTILRPFF